MIVKERQRERKGGLTEGAYSKAGWRRWLRTKARRCALNRRAEPPWDLASSFLLPGPLVLIWAGSELQLGLPPEAPSSCSGKL